MCFPGYSYHKQFFLFIAFASIISAPPLEKSWLRPCLKPHQSSRRHVQYVQHLLCLDWITARKAKFLFQFTTLNPKILIELKTHLCYMTVLLGGEYSNKNSLVSKGKTPYDIPTHIL